jgi:H+/Cl- antiporter ClcA
VAFAVGAGLIVGKEGPLIHMGSIIGVAMAYLPIEKFKYFRNDFEKRNLIAVGVASGVSAAFGSPIGGALYTFELSKPDSFWSYSLTLKVFFSSTIASFTLSLLKQLYEGIFPLTLTNTDVIKLGSPIKGPTLDALVGATIIGFVGGIFGSVYIKLNNIVNVYRKKFLITKRRKVIEGLILAGLTCTAMYIIISIMYVTTNKEVYQNSGKFCMIKNFTMPDDDPIEVPTRKFLCNPKVIDGKEYE